MSMKKFPDDGSYNEWNQVLTWGTVLSYVIHGRETFLLSSMGDAFPASEDWSEASIYEKYLKWADYL